MQWKCNGNVIEMQWKCNRHVIEWNRNAIECNKNARIKYWKVVGMHASSAGIQYKCAQGVPVRIPAAFQHCVHAFLLRSSTFLTAQNTEFDILRFR